MTPAPMEQPRDGAVDEIARAARMKKALTSRFFDSKEEIFVPTVVDYLAEIEARGTSQQGTADPVAASPGPDDSRGPRAAGADPRGRSRASPTPDFTADRLCAQVLGWMTLARAGVREPAVGGAKTSDLDTGRVREARMQDALAIARITDGGLA